MAELDVVVLKEANLLESHQTRRGHIKIDRPSANLWSCALTHNHPTSEREGSAIPLWRRAANRQFSARLEIRLYSFTIQCIVSRLIKCLLGHASFPIRVPPLSTVPH